jgi:hypothetical protein
MYDRMQHRREVIERLHYAELHERQKEAAASAKALVQSKKVATPPPEEEDVSEKEMEDAIDDTGTQTMAVIDKSRLLPQHEEAK